MPPEREHGTLHQYAVVGCRCPDCQRAMADYQAERRAAIREATASLAAEAATVGPIEVPEWPHGTLTGWRRGCRCGPCREAHADYERAYRRRFPGRVGSAHQRGTSTTAHGTRSRYVAGCRCDACAEASREYDRQRRRRRREGT